MLQFFRAVINEIKRIARLNELATGPGAKLGRRIKN